MAQSRKAVSSARRMRLSERQRASRRTGTVRPDRRFGQPAERLEDTGRWCAFSCLAGTTRTIQSFLSTTTRSTRRSAAVRASTFPKPISCLFFLRQRGQLPIRPAPRHSQSYTLSGSARIWLSCVTPARWPDPLTQAELFGRGGADPISCLATSTNKIGEADRLRRQSDWHGLGRPNRRHRTGALGPDGRFPVMASVAGAHHLQHRGERRAIVLSSRRPRLSTRRWRCSSPIRPGLDILTGEGEDSDAHARQ